MRYQGNFNFRSFGVMTGTVKKLLIINGIIFLLQIIIGFFTPPGTIERIFGLSHVGLFRQFMIWQPFTYMFLHGGFLHIIFNMFMLWMFGRDIEQLWGKSLFIKYYIFSGVGAGIFIAILNYIVYSVYGTNINTIGASGAINGLLIAYGMTWPNREVLLWMLFPVKIKYVIIGLIVISFIGTVSSAMGTGGAISHIGHLGGIVSGFIFIWFRKNRSRLKKNSSGKKEKEQKKIINFEKKQKKQNDEEENRIKAKYIIDTLLEKIAKNGMESLSKNEKSDLEWARRHYYPNNEDKIQ